MALPVLRGSSSVDVAVGATFTLPKPAGTVAGDVLIATICSDPLMSDTQTGWTLRGKSTVNAPVSVFWKVAGGSEPASYTFTAAAGSGNTVTAYLEAWSGVNTTTPIGAFATGGSAADVTPLVAPSVSPTIADSILVAAYATRGAVQTFTPPPGMTESFDHGDTTGFLYLDVNRQALASTAATGTRSATPALADSYSSVAYAISGVGAVQRVTDRWNGTALVRQRTDRWSGTALILQGNDT